MNPIQVMARRSMGRFRADGGGMTLDDVQSLLSLDGGMFIGGSALRGDEEISPATLEFMSTIYSHSAAVFSALQTRWKIFSQARFQFQQMFGGRAGALYGTPDLAPLEHPEPGETTLDLAFRAMQYADLAGDWFGIRRPASVVRLNGPDLPYGNVDRIKSLRPDWTVIVLGSRRKTDPMDLVVDPDAEIVGFGYTPRAPGSTSNVIAYGREEVAHFHPNTNPLSRYRGQPLIYAALPEILADQGATQYKRAFFRNAATPNLAVGFPPTWDEEKAKAWLAMFDKKHRGATNAFKTMYLGGGMTATPVGNNFKDMTFKDLAGLAETRIAAITGMHPVIIPMTEGMAGSSLAAGNYNSAKRSTADITLRYLWPNMCGSLETIVPPPAGSRLWFDIRSVPFLAADVTDQAAAMTANVASISSLINSGFDPDSATDAVTAGDLNRLVHTGLISVQLQPPGADLSPAPDAPDAPAEPDVPDEGAAAQRFNLTSPQLRRMLEQGWRPARASDVALIRNALARDPGSVTFRATQRFWPADGPMSAEIAAGTLLAGDDPRVVAYPSLFVRADPPPQVSVSVPPVAALGPGPALIVTAAAVRAKRAELRSAGRDAGYGTLARELGVSEKTIRRRLAER